MPISHDKKLIFAHVPKCMGSSIEKALNIQELDLFYSQYKCKDSLPGILNEFSGIEKIKVAATTPQHLTLSQLRKVLPFYNDYTKFSVVRNPYDRLVSDYHYTQNIKYNIFRYFKNITFNEFVKRVFNLSEIDRHITFDSHFSTQASFLYSDGELLCDKLFKYENPNEVFQWLDVQPQHELKSTDRKHYSEYYNTETKDIVRYFYQKDFELFSYDI